MSIQCPRCLKKTKQKKQQQKNVKWAGYEFVCFWIGFCFIWRLIIVSALHYASEMSQTKSELLEDG